jgi:hypothetical protein|tara:strand:- start:1288 stop:1464 length:177 start_codon:yes stop_codon:yes gene_type:complete
MAVKLAPTDADLYFEIDDERIRDCLRQLFDNTRILNTTVKDLEERVFLLETEKDTDFA